MLSIITPCTRPFNLTLIYNSIDFSKIHKWYICYDATKIHNHINMFCNEQIVEIFVDGTCVNSMFGNEQRNVGMRNVQSGYVFFLDDDNLMHPDFFSSVDTTIPEKLYTFDRVNNMNKIKSGAGINNGKGIDVAQFCADISLLSTEKFAVGLNTTKEQAHNADSRIIYSLLKKHSKKHIYIPKVLAYYNKIRVIQKNIHIQKQKLQKQRQERREHNQEDKNVLLS